MVLSNFVEGITSVKNNNCKKYIWGNWIITAKSKYGKIELTQIEIWHHWSFFCHILIFNDATFNFAVISCNFCSYYFCACYPAQNFAYIIYRNFRISKEKEKFAYYCLGLRPLVWPWVYAIGNLPPKLIYTRSMFLNQVSCYLRQSNKYFL